MLKSVREKLVGGMTSLVAWVVGSVLASAEEQIRVALDESPLVTVVLPPPKVSLDESVPSTRREELKAMGMPAIRKLATQCEIATKRGTTKHDVIEAILRSEF